MPAQGDRVEYVAIAGGVYPALVQAVHPDGTLDLEVDPDSASPLKLTKVPYYETPRAVARRIARPARREA